MCHFQMQDKRDKSLIILFSLPPALIFIPRVTKLAQTLMFIMLTVSFSLLNLFFHLRGTTAPVMSQMSKSTPPMVKSAYDSKVSRELFERWPLAILWCHTSIGLRNASWTWTRLQTPWNSKMCRYHGNPSEVHGRPTQVPLHEMFMCMRKSSWFHIRRQHVARFYMTLSVRFKSWHVMQQKWFFRLLPVCTHGKGWTGGAVFTHVRRPTGDARADAGAHTGVSARSVCGRRLLIYRKRHVRKRNTWPFSVFQRLCHAPAVAFFWPQTSRRIAVRRAPETSVNGKHLHNTRLFCPESTAFLWLIGWTPGQHIWGKMETFFAEVGLIFNDGASAMI